ncbi:MAG: Z1 domain-containing protein [Christensenellaceae bacterium]
MSQNIEEVKRNILFDRINVQYDEDFIANDRTPTTEEFDSMANCVRQQLKFIYTDAEFDYIKDRVREVRSVKIGVGIFVEKKSPEHEFWYGNRSIGQENYYNERFKEYLFRAKKWSRESIASLDKNTSDIMDRIGDPQKCGKWRRKGLLIGDVQSGKTANYTSICNKAIDSGYKVIIVLAGLTNTLRRQTQQRLENDFVGLQKPVKSTQPGEVIPSRKVGVGAWGQTGSMEVEVFTSTERDFSKAVADTTSISFSPNAMPRLFVVKKNKSVLTNLETWLREVSEGGKIDSPLLLIDDESDNASVNTKDDTKPSAINACIRNILKLFSGATYLGVTATPFANIFINPYVGDNDTIDADLFPEDFIYCIPSPNTYIGSEKMFRSDGYCDAIIPIDEAEVADSFKFGHKKDIDIPYLPDGLKKAIRYFMLTNCIRDKLGQEASHRSMMINVSRFVDVQNLLKEKVDSFWKRIKLYAQSYAKQGVEALQYDEIKELKKIWDEYELSVVAKCDWNHIQPLLFDSNKDMLIMSVNQKSVDKLDYDEYYKENKKYIRVIAVGGDCLSRGLTLEGLSVSYFYRNSKMYDTLMQMGRWFGYRPGYGKLVKVWMATDAIEWYTHISAVTEQLMLEVYRMNRNELTPMDFGFKIQGHPDALIPTATNKMKNAEKDFKYVDLEMAGRLIESPRLINNENYLKLNENSVRNFIKAVSAEHTLAGGYGNDLFWSGVNSEDVATLVRGFKSSSWHHYFNSIELADYIQETQELWDVYIKKGDLNPFKLEVGCGEIDFGCQERGNTLIDHNIIKVSGTHVRVGWGGCTAATLSPQKKAELDSEYRKTDLSKKDGKDGEYKETPDDFYLYGAARPILFIHFLYLTQRKKDKNGKDIVPFEKTPVFEENRVIVALGLGFPSDEEYVIVKTNKAKRKKMRYYLNKIATQLKDEEGDDNSNDY